MCYFVEYILYKLQVEFLVQSEMMKKKVNNYSSYGELEFGQNQNTVRALRKSEVETGQQKVLVHFYKVEYLCFLGQQSLIHIFKL